MATIASILASKAPDHPLLARTTEGMLRAERSLRARRDEKIARVIEERTTLPEREIAVEKSRRSHRGRREATLALAESRAAVAALVSDIVRTAKELRNVRNVRKEIGGVP